MKKKKRNKIWWELHPPVGAAAEGLVEQYTLRVSMNNKTHDVKVQSEEQYKSEKFYNKIKREYKNTSI